MTAAALATPPPHPAPSPRRGEGNEQPRSKLRGIEHPSLNSFRGKPRGIEPGGIKLPLPRAGEGWGGVA